MDAFTKFDILNANCISKQLKFSASLFLMIRSALERQLSLSQIVLRVALDYHARTFDVYFARREAAWKTSSAGATRSARAW
jgi:hypothetical protein